MPTWVKVAIDTWTTPAGVAHGHVFRSVNRGGQVQHNVSFAISTGPWQAIGLASHASVHSVRCGVSAPTTVFVQDFCRAFWRAVR
jgi:hypothetical protein